MKTELTKEQIIAIVMQWEKELKDNYKENNEAFGPTDKDTQRAFSKWFEADDLLTRLNLEQ